MPLRPATSTRRLARFATLTLMTLACLASVPSQGAGVHLERPKPRVQMPAADRWSLRPTEPVMPNTTGSIRGRTETSVLEGRRHVRLVYPALIEAR